MASFDHIVGDYSGGFGRFQVLLIIMNIVVGFEFYHVSIVNNVIYPRSSLLQEELFRCVPMYAELDMDQYKFSVIDNVYQNVKNRCETFLVSVIHLLSVLVCVR